VIVISEVGSGTEVGRTTTGPDGSYSILVPSTGRFVVTAQPVAGLVGTPSPVTVTLSSPGQHERVDLVYDTGIR
jgi:hypothetical protein